MKSSYALQLQTVLGRLEVHEELDDEDVAAILGYIRDLESLCDEHFLSDVFGTTVTWRQYLGLEL